MSHINFVDTIIMTFYFLVIIAVIITVIVGLRAIIKNNKNRNQEGTDLKRRVEYLEKEMEKIKNKK